MKCQCGAGYCPEDNLTYPCVCEKELLNSLKEDKEVSSFLVNFFYEEEQEYFEEDDLPF